MAGYRPLSARAGLSFGLSRLEECRLHTRGGGLCHVGARVGVANGLTYLRVPQDLHHDTLAYPVRKEQRRRGVTRVVQPRVTQACVGKERLPTGPVPPRVDRLAIFLAEDEVMVLPVLAGPHAFLH